MNCNKGNVSQWMGCRVIFSATRDGRRVDSIEITGCQAVFDRSKDLGEQAGSAVADWVSRQEQVHGYRYQDAEISYLEVVTSDGRYLDATKLGWGVLDERRQDALAAAQERSEIESALIQAIQESGFSVSGPTDLRAAEHGEPAWVCNARAALAQHAARRLPVEPVAPAGPMQLAVTMAFLWQGFIMSPQLVRVELSEEEEGHYSGQIGAAQRNLSRWAVALDSIIPIVGEYAFEYSGVFEYEVTEAVGAYLRKMRCAMEEQTIQQVARWRPSSLWRATAISTRRSRPSLQRQCANT